MRAIKKRVEKLEDALGREDVPLMVISVEPGQTEQEAIKAFYKRYPQVHGLVIILERRKKFIPPLDIMNPMATIIL